MSLFTELNSMVSYDPLTGLITWKVRPINKRGSIGDVVGRNHNGYLRSSINKNVIMNHRIAWILMTGEDPPDQIDHINGNRSDNRWENLRSADATTNNHNRKRANKNNRTGLLGVKLLPNAKFLARIRVKGKLHNLGVFSTAIDAHTCYLAAKRLLHEGNTL